jgi:hypothetical protein
MVHEPNPIKLVAWFMAAKNVIKFANDDTTYKLGEAVIKASNFEKFPLSKGDKVEVGITDGIIIYLRKQKSVPQESESKGSEEAYEPTPAEEKPINTLGTEDTTTIKQLTVFAVAANKKVVKFLECKDAGWFQISETIQAQDYATIGLIAKNKVQVTFNDKTVISLVKVASEAPQQEKTTTSSPANAKVEPTAAPAAQAPAQAAKKEWKPYSQDSGVQKSIEAQAAVNAASNVAGRIGASLPQAPTASVVNNMIRAIAESNFALIQELKSK